MLGIIQVAKGFTLHWSNLRMLASVRCSRSVQICCPRYGFLLFSLFLFLSVCLSVLSIQLCIWLCTTEEQGLSLLWKQKKKTLPKWCFKFWRKICWSRDAAFITLDNVGILSGPASDRPARINYRDKSEDVNILQSHKTSLSIKIEISSEILNALRLSAQSKIIKRIRNWSRW